MILSVYVDKLTLSVHIDQLTLSVHVDKLTLSVHVDKLTLSVHVDKLTLSVHVDQLTLGVHVCSMQLDQQRQAPPGEPTRDYVESLVDREKHMKEHRAPLPAYQDPPAYPEGRPLPETPEYTNTSAVFTASPYLQRSSSEDDNNM